MLDPCVSGRTCVEINAVSAVRAIEPSEIDMWTFDACVAGLEVIHVLVQNNGLVGDAEHSPVGELDQVQLDAASRVPRRDALNAVGFYFHGDLPLFQTVS